MSTRIINKSGEAADPGDHHPELLSSGSLGLISPDSLDWREVRDQFPLREDMIYMNCGTEGSMSRRTLERYHSYNSEWARSPSYYFFDSRKLGAREYQQANREAIGQFIGANWENVCLTNNTTMGLAMALLGQRLERGDEILTSDHEHWSLISPLTALTNRGVKIEYVPIEVPLSDGNKVIEAFAARTTKATKVIAVSHITWSTGARLPVKGLCELARERGIKTVIDGAHALGAIALDLGDLGCDFYATSGHKWLNGPPGTGVLYIQEAHPANFVPILAESIPNINTTAISTQLQIRGCNNTAGFAAMVDAAGFADELGREMIETRILTMSAYVKRRVQDVWGPTALLSPAPDLPGLGSGMTSFVPSRDVAAAFDAKFINNVVSALWKESRIYVRSVPIPTPQPPQRVRFAIRVSTNIFNSFDEIDRLVSETRRIADALTPSA
jgi:selenocysteine lyase/cysteine desulfurase